MPGGFRVACIPFLVIASILVAPATFGFDRGGP
jgi:hypothetical protein